MSITDKVVKGLAVVGTLLLLYATIFSKNRTHADDQQEVKPYVFAELPHGRIYKTVHEGCELFIVESDIPTLANQPGEQFHHYGIATGRGCR